MLALLLALLIWPFSSANHNQTRNWYASRYQHIQTERAARQHRQTRHRLAERARLFRF